jgi:hypothetical protein
MSAEIKKLKEIKLHVQDVEYTGMYRVIQVLPPARLTLLKNYETLGLHSLHVTLQTCDVQSIFPYHFIQSHKIKKNRF